MLSPSLDCFVPLVPFLNSGGLISVGYSEENEATIFLLQALSLLPTASRVAWFSLSKSSDYYYRPLIARLLPQLEDHIQYFDLNNLSLEYFQDCEAYDAVFIDDFYLLALQFPGAIRRVLTVILTWNVSIIIAYPKTILPKYLETLLVHSSSLSISLLPLSFRRSKNVDGRVFVAVGPLFPALARSVPLPVQELHYKIHESGGSQFWLKGSDLSKTY